jgi:nucleotide-binding universal stress UspA family protein
MKPPGKLNYSSILAAVDVELPDPPASEHDLNRGILELAASLALSDAATLNIAHAWEALAEKIMLTRDWMPPEDAAKYLEKEHERHRKELCRLAGKLRGWIGNEAYDDLSPGLHLPEGPAKKVIPPLAAELRTDLVVMGTVARTGISGVFIGNTAEAILDQLRCSVLAVKPPGFKTPVQLDE